jgi:hypothetical protein
VLSPSHILRFICAIWRAQYAQCSCSLRSFLQSPVTSSLSTPLACALPILAQTKSHTHTLATHTITASRMTWLPAERRGVRLPAAARLFQLTGTSGAHPRGTECSGRAHEADHSHQSGAEVKNEWCYISKPALYDVRRDNRNLYFISHQAQRRMVLNGMLACIARILILFVLSSYLRWV